MALHEVGNTVMPHRVELHRVGPKVIGPSSGQVSQKYEYVDGRILSLEGDALMSAEGDYVLCKVKQIKGYEPATMLSLDGDVLVSSDGDYILCKVKH